MSGVHELTLTLPLPPSPNDWASHPMEQARQKNDYRKRCWVAAISQHAPTHDPPAHVVVSATCYVWNKRDEDNLTGGLKWALDALKREQEGNVRWRQGVADLKGYIEDDSPDHLTLLKPEQVVDRDEQRVELTIRWRDEERAA